MFHLFENKYKNLWDVLIDILKLHQSKNPKINGITKFMK